MSDKIFQNFVALTNEQRDAGFQAIHDSEYRRLLVNQSAQFYCDNNAVEMAYEESILDFVYDSELRKLLYLWIDCKRDMVMTRLKYIQDKS